ncbi:20391_t:CDS:2, partial [Gigaspora margarita]
MEHAVYTHIIKIFEQLLTYHYGAFSNLIQQAFEYILEYEKVPNLLQDDPNYTSRDIFEMFNIKSTANYEIKIPAIKCLHGQPPNNKHICSADEENKENRMPLKKYSSGQKIEKSNLITFKTISIDNAANCNKIEIPAVNGRGLLPKTDAIKQNSDNNGVYINSNIPQNTILQIYNPIGDGYCGFRSLAIQEKMYSNILGYDIKWLIDILLYAKLECSQDYWFYMPECTQLASDAFNVPVVIFGANPIASLFFLLFNQKPGR